MNIKKLALSILAPLLFPISGCRPIYYSINVGKAETREVIFEDFRFVYYEDGAGSLFSKSTGEPLYETPDCSFKGGEGWNVLQRGTPLVGVVEKMGFPKFIGLGLSPSLDFGFFNSTIYRLYFDDDFIYDRCYVRDSDDEQMWVDAFKKELPSIADIENIEIGMSMDEVVTIIGKPQAEWKYDMGIFIFEVDDGSFLWTYWGKRKSDYAVGNYFFLKDMEIRNTIPQSLLEGE